ncbi:hypothetical protein ASE48_20170 [Mycobacterium sp. Root265]|nr:hypothetical protein ASE48_20170 [Mycobacterium sp. Root265]
MSPAELTPVELDPPDPVLARWEELSGRDIAIDHGGDAEKIIPIPRPAWADPDCDEIGKSVGWTTFNSTTAHVPANRMGGEAIGECLLPCGFRVRGRLIGDGWAGVGITMTRYLDEKWNSLGITLTLDEARDFANVILAAVDMVGGEK